MTAKNGIHTYEINTLQWCYMSVMSSETVAIWLFDQLLATKSKLDASLALCWVEFTKDFNPSMDKQLHLL